MNTFEKQDICKKQSGSRIVTFWVFVIVMFVCLFLLQERTYAVACYTDSWGDDSGVPEGTIYDEGDVRNGPYIIGSGVTHMEYFEPYHEASVVTTLTSPSGQQITGYDSDWWGYYKQSFTARAEVELLWNSNEVGTYTLNSEHLSYCPETNFGSTLSSWYLGVSVNVMKYESGGSVPNCNVYCPVYTYTRPNYFGQYVKLYVPRGPFGCLKGSLVVGYANNTPCYEL